VIAFIYADLLIIPIVIAYTKYYGRELTARLVAIMFAGDRAGRARGRRDFQRGGARAIDAALDRLDHESGHLLELHDLSEHHLSRPSPRGCSV
jgi:hypothetical protein